jgi:hypothetical protein
MIMMTLVVCDDVILEPQQADALNQNENEAYCMDELTKLIWRVRITL